MNGPSVRAESTSTVGSSPNEQSELSSRNVKRKVLRRRNGESRVFDESFASTDSGKFNSTEVELAAVSFLTFFTAHICAVGTNSRCTNITNEKSCGTIQHNIEFLSLKYCTIDN